MRAAYTVYEVIGWRLRWSDSVVAIHERAADARWYGNEPELYADKRGAEAEKLIPRIDAAARAYPYAGEYTAWPGPNSNTFTAWITRAVPELEVDLPPTAIGKDYLSGRHRRLRAQRPRRAVFHRRAVRADRERRGGPGTEFARPYLRHQSVRSRAEAALDRAYRPRASQLYYRGYCGSVC